MLEAIQQHSAAWCSPRNTERAVHYIAYGIYAYLIFDWLSKPAEIPHRPETPGECLEGLKLYPEGDMIHKVVEIAGGKNAFCQLPVLPWQKRFLRSAIDIDIRPEDLSALQMRGSTKRPFLTTLTQTTQTGPSCEGFDPCERLTLLETYIQEGPHWIKNVYRHVESNRFEERSSRAYSLN